MENSFLKQRSLSDLTPTSNILGEYLGVFSNRIESLDSTFELGNYKPIFRLYVLHSDETIDYEVPQKDIIIDSGNYTENYQNGQRRNFNISLVNIDGKYTPNINKLWIQNRFRLDVGVQGVGEETWSPRGIYIMGNPTLERGSSEKKVTINLVDKFALFEGKMGTLETTYEIPAGTEIKKALETILTIDTGAGYPLDLKPILYDHSFDGAVTPYTLSKDAGSTLGEMILELGNMLGAEIFYNSFGNLCVIPINETILDKDKPITWNLSKNKKNIINTSMSYDFENVVNEVGVVGNNIKGKICYATAKNEEPTSPICIQRVGRHVYYISDETISTDKLAQDRANYELRKASILATKMTITTTFNPFIFVNNIITIEDSFNKFNREHFIIQSISYSIGVNNQMSITCSNITNVSHTYDGEPEFIVSNVINQGEQGSLFLLTRR